MYPMPHPRTPAGFNQSTTLKPGRYLAAAVPAAAVPAAAVAARTVQTVPSTSTKATLNPGRYLAVPIPAAAVPAAAVPAQTVQIVPSTAQSILAATVTMSREIFFSTEDILEEM